MNESFTWILNGQRSTGNFQRLMFSKQFPNSSLPALHMPRARQDLDTTLRLLRASRRRRSRGGGARPGARRPLRRTTSARTEGSTCCETASEKRRCGSRPRRSSAGRAIPGEPAGCLLPCHTPSHCAPFFSGERHSSHPACKMCCKKKV